VLYNIYCFVKLTIHIYKDNIYNAFKIDTFYHITSFYTARHSIQCLWILTSIYSTNDI